MTRSTRFLLLIAALALATALVRVTPLLGQESARPTFQSGATLVEFTMIATDGRGNPISDLREDEVSIVDDGKPRPVAFFRFEGPATTTSALTTELTPGIFTNRAEYSPGPARNITAIVIDSLNTRPQDQAAVRAQVLRYLRAITPETRIALYRTGETVRVLHDFTDSVAELRARLSGLSIEQYTRPPSDVDVEKVRDAIVQGQLDDVSSSGETTDQRIIAAEEMARLEEYYNQSVQDERTDLTLQALEIVGNHLAGIPGRKNLVWISSGTPLLYSGTRDAWPKSYETAVRALAQRLASEGIAIYPVEATGLMPAELGTSSTAMGSGFGQGSLDAHLDPRAKASALRLRSTLDLMAETTGGRSFKNTNDLTLGVKSAASDMHGAYSISFYVPDAPDNRWHELKVKVQRPGVKALVRQGYMSISPARQPTDWLQDEWQATARNPLGSTAIRIDARVELKGQTLNAILQIPSQDLSFHRANLQWSADLDLGLAERGTVDGSRVRTDHATVTLKNENANLGGSLIRLPKSWTLNPGTSSVRLIVRDRVSGRFGVLDMPLAKLLDVK